LDTLQKSPETKAYATVAVGECNKQVMAFFASAQATLDENCKTRKRGCDAAKVAKRVTAKKRVTVADYLAFSKGMMSRGRAP
jgi:hypothetical protein